MRKGKGYIESLIAEGEHVHQDFKYQITDARKIARSISAFANNSGGHLLVGVKDNGRIVGVSDEEEIYMIEQAATMYCRPEQHPKCKIYRVDGKNVLKVDIEEATEKPVKAPDEHGNWKAYYRVADENILASAVHVKAMTHQNQDATIDDEVVINYTDNERLLLDYLNSHGGISIDGYIKLAHISRPTAEQSVINLYRIGVVELDYLQNGVCLITSTDEQI